MPEAAEPLPANRDETGNPVGPGNPPTETRFRPGTSGNPTGRPKGIARRAREIASGRENADGTGEQLDNGETVLLFLANVMASSAEKTRDRIDAAKILLERGWGKPPQFAPIEDDDPLDFSDEQANELAASLDARLDELAAKRAAKKK